MIDTTHAGLDRICSEICDNLCRYPRECANQEALEDRCASCRTLVDLANLVERVGQAKEKEKERQIQKYCRRCHSKDPRELQSMKVLQYKYCPECGRNLQDVTGQ